MLFDREICGQNEKVGPEMVEKSNGTKACRWCRLVESGDHVVFDGPAFVLLEGPSRRRGGYITLVTRAHASLLTELPAHEMAAVLAGLTKASERMRGTSGTDGIQIRPHPSGASGGRGHLHFQLVPEVPGARRPFDEPLEGRSAFASLVEAISH
jgi:diadenosine tetraphosphate (Ap4A) HIT family hydrolase